MRIHLTALLVLAVACGGRSDRGDPAPTQGGAWETVGSGGMFRVRCTPRPDPIPLNEPFSVLLDIAAEEGEARSVEGLVLFVSGWMPDHLHGMNTAPLIEELGAGRYRADGILFHMPGRWELHVDLVAGGLSERASFEHDL